MKALKRVISILLVLCAVLAFAPAPASASGGMTLAELQAKFKEGKYWNGGNADACTDHPCKNDANGNHIETNCNGFDTDGDGVIDAWQCMGFAHKLAYDAYGELPKRKWQSTTSISYVQNSLKPGDVVVTDYHSVFVIGVNGSQITIAECNYRTNRKTGEYNKDDRCVIRWGGIVTVNDFVTWSNYTDGIVKTYIAPYDLLTKSSISSEPPSSGVPSYVVSYDANGGKNAPKTHEKPQGTTMTLRGEIPTRDGYEFVCWNTKKDGSGTDYFPGGLYTADAPAKLYAQWKETPKAYTVSFNANGGTVSPSSMTTDTSFRLGKLPIPTRSGYTFLGWYTGPSGGVKINSSCLFDEDTTLYALWEKMEPEVVIIDTGGNIPSPMGGIAAERQSSLTLNKKWVGFNAYALHTDAGDTNYIKLRDLAYLLMGTGAEFSVGQAADGTVQIDRGGRYTPNKTEMSTPFSGDKTYAYATGTVLVNGAPVQLQAFRLYDSNRGGYTYYKLKDLAKALDFYVDWVPGTGIVLDTSKSYPG